MGIDVSKHQLEWVANPEARVETVRNEPRAIDKLVRRLVRAHPERIVVESTGGYERRLVLKLAEAGLPVVVVNPRRVRSFAIGMGYLAKTDALDARILALFGEKVMPPIRPILRDRPACWPISWPDAASWFRSSSPRRIAARRRRPR